MSRRLLVVRPQSGAARTAERAWALGFDVAVYPLFAILPVAWQSPDPTLFDALLLTSANAVRHAGAKLTRYVHLPTFAVGEATAKAARAAGFAKVLVGGADAQAIVRTIAAHGHVRLLHLAGRDVRPFEPAPLVVMRVSVYEARAVGDADDIAALVQPGAIVLAHSARAAARLASLLPLSTRASLHLVAISSAVMQAAGAGWGSAQAAARPDDNALLALAASLCE
ncbi:hypothetical protein BH10PSE12_BH10PSE12_14200 [soil metagenome]